MTKQSVLNSVLLLILPFVTLLVASHLDPVIFHISAISCTPVRYWIPALLQGAIAEGSALMYTYGLSGV